MDLSLVNADTINLLSRITSKKLQAQDLTPALLFLAALLTVLLGVIFADTAVVYREEQRLQGMLDSLVPTDEDMKQMTQFMIGGIDWHHVYINPIDWLTLTAPLSYAERLLLLGLGYEMSRVDDNVDPREVTYLQEVGHRLEIANRHLVVLEYSFAGGNPPQPSALDEVRQLLDPQQFMVLGSTFVNVSRDLLNQVI
jgi:uncharacterized tellurite resistance protein B-like protein